MNATFNTRRAALAPDVPNLAVTVSGSFHRHLHAINAAVEELAELSVRVLSPADPRIVAAQGEFLFVASDRVRSVRLVQDRHLESIAAANFLWLVCPDGYVGQSASLEVGYAIRAEVPIFATHAPEDLTLRQYVTVVSSLKEALRVVAADARSRRREGLLIDPHASVEEAHEILDQMRKVLTRPGGMGNPGGQIDQDLRELQAELRLTSCVQ